jgi:DNA recombination-dependent growth factor C
MGLVKGSVALCRWRVLEEFEGGLTDELVQERLRRDAFIDIEDTPEESSIGWVELLNHLGTAFEAGTYDFGPFLGFTLRLDERKLPARILNRYCAIAEARHEAETGRPPNTLRRRQIKESTRLELMRRSLLSTSLFQCVWIKDRSELWLDSGGEKVRQLFEDQWARTFGLALRLMVPVSLGIELLPEGLARRLLTLEPAGIWR